MIGILILSHGGLAHELLKTAEAITGRDELAGFAAVSLEWTDSLEAATAKARKALEALGPLDGVLILTDMFGGTPYNVALTFRRPGEVEVVTGVNVPMVLRLACRQEGEPAALEELAVSIQSRGRHSIRRADADREPFGIDRAAARKRSGRDLGDST